MSPAYENFLPIGATNVKLTSRGIDYAINTTTMCFTRAGEDGNVIILPLFGGDEFEGTILEGHWKKFWSGGMDADQTFTAILDGAGILEFEGEADVAGTWGYGKIASSHILPIVNELELQVSMQIPVDDTGAVADRDIFFWFVLNQTAPSLDFNADDCLRFTITVDETGLRLAVTKESTGVPTTLCSGYDYTMDTTFSTGALEAVVWRITFHDGHPDETGTAADRHIHVYLRQAAILEDAELTSENEVTGSPFDISDLFFDTVYPEFMIGSQNTTYFDSGGEAKTTYVRVDYPDMRLSYDASDANRLLNEVEIWDGDPDSGGVKVYDVDHTFSNDVYIQNGLIRTWTDEGAAEGMKLYSYYSASWSQEINSFRPYLVTSAKNLRYPYAQSIRSISSEKIVVRVKGCDSAVNDDDYFIIYDVTIKRGSYYFEFSVVELVPIEGFSVYLDRTNGRFTYVGDNSINDVDVVSSGHNTTMSDNFNVNFDDGNACLVHLSANKKPFRFNAFNNALYWASYPTTSIDGLIWYVGLFPFSLVANLFEQAEDGSIGAAGTVTDVLASPLAGANNAVQLNAIGDYKTPAGEYSVYAFTAGTHLPEGRYLAVVRAKYVVEETMNMYVWNNTDNEYRNEENAEVTKTLTSAWAYYSLVFDITAADVTGTDAFAIVAEKSTDDADEIRTDYALVVPIGDGESLPQDLAHGALRSVKQERRLLLR